MTAAQKRQWAARRRCWICRLSNDEIGQRGPRQAHNLCRKLVDNGHTVQQAAAVAARERQAAS